MSLQLTQLRKGTLEFCVLAVLEQGPAYGLEIAEELMARETLLQAQGTLYPLLGRLRKRGLVSTRWEESPTGPPRRYYALTDLGHETIATFRSVWKPFSEDVDTMLGSRDA
ncbi:PadR family transcriptional regulator [Euzebya tangerina]|uniref:PadR family transcriptional regulator n=1 Tax=Euzebya tangerina TaxID=591198 RepID=UPI000E315040|nr:PadR family transcriptional regulator [Euzebya tangerina]